MEEMLRKFERIGSLLQQNNERMECVEVSVMKIERRKHPRRRDRRRNEEDEPKEYDGDDYDEEDERGEINNNRRYGGRHRGVRNREDRAAIFGGGARRNIRRVDNGEDSSLGNIKMKIPSFQGKNDLKAYLEWEKKME